MTHSDETENLNLPKANLLSTDENMSSEFFQNPEEMFSVVNEVFVIFISTFSSEWNEHITILYTI